MERTRHLNIPEIPDFDPVNPADFRTTSMRLHKDFIARLDAVWRFKGYRTRTDFLETVLRIVVERELARPDYDQRASTPPTARR